MRRTIRLTERDLSRIVKKILNENPISTPTQTVPLFDDCPDKMNNLVRLIGKSNVPSSCLKSVNSSNDISDLEKTCVDSLKPLWKETYDNLDYRKIKSRSYKKDTEIITAIHELTQCYWTSEDIRMNNLFDF